MNLADENLAGANLAEDARVNDLFLAAAELPASERVQFLTIECGGDTRLRARVNLLLVEHERMSGLLDRPLFATPGEADLWAGRVVDGRYRIGRLVGRGGTSTVYLAQDMQLAGRRVVVKFLHSWARPYPWVKDKFRKEMEALARIDHPAVVGILDVGETSDGLPYLVIEYVDGITLRQAMERGPLEVARAARIIRETGRAVAAAHAKGVVHRDLKPENIMLELPDTREERVRIIDFGIARVEETGGAATVTQTTQFAGTTPYMAPEQLRGNPVPASDTFALAVVACEMLAGQRPFSAASPVELYEQQRGGAQLKLLRAHPGISEDAVRGIRKQLSFNPADRSLSALDASERIADALLRPTVRNWSRRRVAAVLSAGALSAAGVETYRLVTRRIGALDASARVIELPQASEPLEHGFRPRDIIDLRIVPNADATGFEAMRMLTTDQGGYYHEMTAPQAKAAQREGWKLICDLAVEEGNASAAMDVPNAPHRYAVNLLRNAGGPDIVRLVTGISPVLKGMDWTIPGPPGARHEFVLAQRALSDTAELWVDGVKRLTGYPGVDEFRYQRGAEFGIARYRSARGVGVYWRFRLEIGA